MTPVTASSPTHHCCLFILLLILGRQEYCGCDGFVLQQQQRSNNAAPHHHGHYHHSSSLMTVSSSSSSSTQLSVSLTTSGLEADDESKASNEAASLDDTTTTSSSSYAITKEQAHPIIRLGKGDKEKIINAFGLFSAIAAIVTCPFWSLAMTITNAVNKLNDNWDPHRAFYDRIGKIWSRTWLTLSRCYPKITGNIGDGGRAMKAYDGPCLYVANHASWLDIPVLCTVLDPVFKFIAKGELGKVPCIGQQLSGGKHILIDRDDRRSQLRTVKEGMKWLKQGVPLMAFPEGKRSRDGRLMDFKGGLFLMAVKTKVPIIPITICNAHAVMPTYSLFPVQKGGGKLRVHVHEPIPTTDKKEEELIELVREAFVSELPPDQQPIIDTTTASTAVEEEDKSTPETSTTESVGP